MNKNKKQKLIINQKIKLKKTIVKKKLLKQLTNLQQIIKNFLNIKIRIYNK